jgi:hypothetical protein
LIDRFDTIAGSRYWQRDGARVLAIAVLEAVPASFLVVLVAGVPPLVSASESPKNWLNRLRMGSRVWGALH